ncbi:hypothetical protein M199_gp276 [Halogranum tailed virus 1]|uniref:Uncharacterized protein n=1 Tax=Halogranum tailed virus 1 TaxID=1273749 RepID=R4T935_9CAUD|nr:hypothetical protein M199_gp276 [Halogranum tailed virus 1]AGM11390.1 hypothetical protein HGTV1_64 [Halogranum tailed virus 1]
MKRRLKRVEVSKTFLADMLKSRRACETDLPEDAQFIELFPDFERDTYWLVLHSEEWDIVPEGGKIPRLEITVTEYEDSTRR